MAKDLVLRKTFGSVESMKAYAADLARVASGVVSGDGLPILKLDKDDGFWHFGSEGIEVKRGDLWAVNPARIQEGWVAFDERANSLAETIDGDLAEVLVLVGSQKPIKFDDLPELEEPRSKRAKMPVWKPQIVLEFVCVDGPNKGETIAYKPTSQGGRKMCGQLAGEIARKIDHEDEACVPIIELLVGDYEHQTYGRVYTPKFKIHEWCTLDDEDLQAATAEREGEEGEEEEAPRGRSGKGRGKAKSKGRRDDGDSAVEARKARSRKDDREDDENEDEDEDEDEAAPRGRGRGRGRGRSRDRDDSEREKAPTRGRGRPRKDDSEDEDEAPRGRRHKDDAERDGGEEDDERPRGRGRARKSRDDNEDEAAPRGRKRGRDDGEEDTDDEDRRGGPRGRNRSRSAGRR